MTKTEQSPAGPNPVCREHSGLVTRLEEHERRLNAGSERMDKIDKAITDMRDGLLSRPSWWVLAIITVLSSLVVGLLAAAVAAGKP